MNIGTEADVSAHFLVTSGKRTQLRELLDTGVVLSVIPIETWERMGFDKEDLIDSRIRLSAANKGALLVLGRTPIIALNLGECNLWMSFLVVENLDESDPFILGRDFIRIFDVTIDLNNAMFRIRNPERKYVIKPVNLIMANDNKAPVFLYPYCFHKTDCFDHLSNLKRCPSVGRCQGFSDSLQLSWTTRRLDCKK